MSKISKDVLVSTTAKQIERAETNLAEAREIYARLMHEYPALARIMWLQLEAQDQLLSACSRLLDLVRGEHA